MAAFGWTNTREVLRELLFNLRSIARDATLRREARRRDVNALRSTQELLPDLDAIITINYLARTLNNLSLKIEIKAVELTKGV